MQCSGSPAMILLTKCDEGKSIPKFGVLICASPWWMNFISLFLYLFYFILFYCSFLIYLLSPNSKIYFSYTKADNIMVRENQALPVGKPWPSAGCCIPSHVRRHFSKPDAIRNKAFRLDYWRYHLNNFTIKWCFFNKNIRLNDMKEWIQWNFTGIMQRIS